jgi:hypothetical protein
MQESRGFRKYCKTGMFYEGKFKDDRPHGEKVKYWYKNGHLMFSGELVLGRRENLGKFFDETGNVIFSGIFRENKFWEGKLELVERGFNLGDSLCTNFSNFKGSFKCEVVKGALKFGVLKNLENSSRVMGNFGIQDKLANILLETLP